MYTDHNLPQKFLSRTKWDRLHITLAWVSNHAKQNLKAPYKTVLEKHGLLVYCTITYSFLIADMKVMHLSVEAYRSNNETEDWEHELL